MRITVVYSDANCNPRIGVPPESIWVSLTPQTGNVKVNDQMSGGTVYADGATDSQGFTRITVPSFSGCGNIRARVLVSGVDKGFLDVRVRTTDSNASGDAQDNDNLSPCDLNYDGAANSIDAVIAASPHTQGKHSHRFALHGKLLQRTNLSETGIPRIGDSVNFWSPSGRWISFTIITSTSPPVCKVFLAASDPKDGDYLRQFSFDSIPGNNFRDYDPSWSPLGDLIVYDRDDWTVMSKGIPGVAGVTDTVPHILTRSGEFRVGDYTPCVSPNGQWVAFSRRDVNDSSTPAHIWKIPIGGGTAKQLTSGSNRIDNYPRWSPDGEWIYFDRQTDSHPANVLWKVKQDSSSLQVVYQHPDPSFNAATPAVSPDSKILTAAIGTRSNSAQDTRAYTFDAALAAGQHKPVANFTDPAFSLAAVDPLLSPVLSPDGTRLLLSARQVWAARRNMNLPPRITQVGVQGLNDSTARVFVNVIQNAPSTTTITATDAEGDTLTYRAFFMPPGMSLVGNSLSWTPTTPVGSKSYVKVDVTTRSGGTDAVIVIFTVVSPFSRSQPAVEQRVDHAVFGPNPTRGRFVIAAPGTPAAAAMLTLFDIHGRQVASVRGRGGEQLIWEGRDLEGRRMEPGVYLYLLESAGSREHGRVVLLD